MRELRNDTAGVLRRVEAGESILITKRGKPVAEVVPHRPQEPRWMPREELVAFLETHAADPGLKGDLERIAGETTDEDDLDRLW